MDRRKTLSILIVLLLFVACQQQKSEQEDFQTFFEKFNTDEEFQKSRVIFPFLTQYYDLDIQAYQTDKTDEKDWEQQNFEWDSTYMQRQEDAYVRELIHKNDTTIIHFKGIQNGINVQAIFVCKDNKWYYLKVINNSM